MWRNTETSANLILGKFYTNDMNTPAKIVMGIGAFLGIAYYGTYRKAYNTFMKCRVAIDRVYLDAIDRNGFILGVRVKVTNPTRNTLRISNGNKLYFYINNQRLAHVYVPYNQVILPEQDTELNLAVSADFSDIGGWWNILLDVANTADIKVAGSLKINGLSVPIPPITVYRYNIENIIKNVKNYSGI